MNAEWSPVPGFPMFEVTREGGVRVKPREVQCTRRGIVVVQKRPGQVLKPHRAKTGYLVVAFKSGNARKKFMVHRLVALAFVPGFAQGLTVNHINGVKTDNRAENLEWVSLAENTRLQWRDGLVDLRGESQPGSKLTARQVKIIRRMLAMGATACELAALARVNSTTIYKIRDGASWLDV